MIIRDVEDRDAQYVIEYAKAFADYYPSGIPFDLHNTLILLEQLSENGIFLVAEKDGKVVGGIGGSITPFPYSPSHLVATELFLWVDEEYRGGSVGYRLLKQFEAEAKEAGCYMTAMTSTSLTPSFQAALKKQGYNEVEVSYLKEL